MTSAPRRRPPRSPSRPREKARSGTPDELDRRLIALLQANARESAADLARKLGVARTTIRARLVALERDGTIVGYTVRLRQDVDDTGLDAYVGIAVAPRAGRDVVKLLGRLPELRQLASVSGEFDYLALVRAASATRLDALLDEIGELEGVLRTTTSIVLARRVDRLAG